jgi:hypothetical protein
MAKKRKFDKMGRYEGMFEVVKNSLRTYHIYAPVQGTDLVELLEKLASLEAEGNSELLQEYEQVVEKILTREILPLEENKKGKLTFEDCPYKNPGLERTNWLIEHCLL